MRCIRIFLTALYSGPTPVDTSNEPLRLEGQAHRHGKSAAGPVTQPDVAAMLRDNRPHDGKSQPGPFNISAPRRIPAIERLEHQVPLAFRYSGAMIRDGEDRLAGVRFELDICER